MNFLSERIRKIPESETLSLVAKANKLRAEGKKVISFAAGELDFPTPSNIIEETISAIRGGNWKYSPSSGLPDLRKAIAKYVSQKTGVRVSEGNVAVTSGAKQAIFNTLFSVIDNGDKVIVISPYWVSYPAMVTLAGGIPVIVDSKQENGFKISKEDIEACIKDHNPKAIIINSPSNPTGSIYSQEELLEIYESCKKRNIFIISDEIYSSLVYDGARHFSVLNVAGKITDEISVIDGMSKSFAMTGWRIGWLIGASPLVQNVSKMTAQTTSCAVTFIQRGCIKSLLEGDDPSIKWKDELQTRRDKMVSLINSSGLVSCHKPAGAFYIWVDVSQILSKKLPSGKIVETSSNLSEYLIEDGNLIAVPGSAFGREGFLRFSFAVSMEEIEEGVKRFIQSIKKLN